LLPQEDNSRDGIVETIYRRLIPCAARNAECGLGTVLASLDLKTITIIPSYSRLDSSFLSVPLIPTVVADTEGHSTEFTARFDLPRSFGRPGMIGYFITELTLLPAALLTLSRVLFTSGAIGRLL
jgi:hypothetical protein